MSPMTDSQYERVLGAISDLNEKFSLALSNGLANLNTAILSVAKSHAESLLAQERRNSQFASRDELGRVAGRQDGFADGAARRDERIKVLEERTTTLETNTFWRTSNVIGYLALALISVAIAVVTFLLTHAHLP